MIKFEHNPSPDFFDLVTREVELDFSELGGEKVTIEIHSLASFRVRDELQKFNIRNDYAKKEEQKGNNIMIESGEIDAGLGVTVEGKVATEWCKKHNALLAEKCVTGYPQERDCTQDLVDNPELCAFVIEQAIQLQTEFLAKKKS